MSAQPCDVNDVIAAASRPKPGSVEPDAALVAAARDELAPVLASSWGIPLKATTVQYGKRRDVMVVAHAATSIIGGLVALNVWANWYESTIGDIPVSMWLFVTVLYFAWVFGGAIPLIRFSERANDVNLTLISAARLVADGCPLDAVAELIVRASTHPDRVAHTRRALDIMAGRVHGQQEK